ncbi:unnamed protein product [Phytomonas sp. Hart1]|nr:unnamed protein product [Phytomonas sp. Hart1]|eukprot:CCW67846.1 unnamed protein product [Phytomonas sp. isolate Hart1]
MEGNVIDQVQRYLLDSKAENRQKGVRLMITKTDALFRDFPSEDACSKLLIERSRIEEIFLNTPSAVQRHGGVVALRAIVKGLPSQQYPPEFVRLFCIPIFNSFMDGDPVVRVAATEATYELLRKLNTQVLQVVFKELFVALSCAINDKDCRASLLAREISNMLRERLSGNDDFSLDLGVFVQFICETLEPHSSASLPPELRLSTSGFKESLVVQWVLEWISHVLDMPGHHLIDYLPDFLPILFALPMKTTEDMLWKLLQTCRSEFRKALRVGRSSSDSVCIILRILISIVYTIEYPLSKRLCFEWMCDLVDQGNQASASGSQIPLYDAMLLCALRHVGSLDSQLEEAVRRVNSELMSVVIRSGAKASGNSLSNILVTITDLMGTGKGCAETHLAALEWIILLHHQDVKLVESCFDDISKAILTLLGDKLTKVYTKAIEALCLVTNEKHLKSLLDGIFLMVRQMPSVLLPRLSDILKQMQVCFESCDQAGDQCDTLLVAICNTLPEISDKRFVCKCVITLNNVLLTSSEFSKLRQVLKQGVASSEQVRNIFVQLGRGWSFNGVALLALCLLTRSYRLSLAICQYLGEIELSPSTLFQVDRLAQMLEGPVFSFLRVAMLTPLQCMPLIQTLFGLLLLLPQTSPQYKILYNRLKVVPSLAQLGREESGPVPPGKGQNNEEDKLWVEVHEPLFHDFKRCQEHVTAFEQSADL